MTRNQRNPLAVFLRILALIAAATSGDVRADPMGHTWVGGIELPNRYFFFVAQIDSGAEPSTGTLYFADGEPAPVAIEAYTEDRVRMILPADGTSYALDARVDDNELNGTFSPKDEAEPTFPLHLVPMHRMSMESLERFTGTYVFDDGSQLQVRAVSPGYLRTYAADQGRFHNLYPTSDRDFLQAADLARPDDQVTVAFRSDSLEHGTRGPARRVADAPLHLAWAESEGAAVVELVEGTPLHLLRVSAGAFGMGSPVNARDAETLLGFEEGMIRQIEHPQRPTEITTDYWMGRSEVTNAQFQVFVDQEAYVTTAELEGSGLLWIDEQFQRIPGACWRRPGREIQPDEPVVLVSWHDASAFCDWLSRATGREMRLPTEAEWEYASRAGTASLYAHGNDPAGLEDYAWFSTNAGGRPHAIETRAPNAWGFHDMHGNVWEWCADWYEPVDAGTPAVDPSGPESGEEKVLRGGSWINGAFDCRSSYRAHDDPGLAEPHFGFRVLAKGRAHSVR